jgi:hypothetical protein
LSGRSCLAEQHWHLFHLHESRIQIPRPREKNLPLQSTASTAVKERLGVLEVVVACDDRTGEFACVKRMAVAESITVNNANLHREETRL